MKKIKLTYRTWLYAAAFLMITLGIVFISAPVTTLYSSAWIIGVFSLFSGISQLIFSMSATQVPNRASWLLSAILQMLLGLVFVGRGIFVHISLPTLLLIWVLIEGIIIVIQSYDFKKAGYHWWYLICGLGYGVAILGVILLVLTIGGAFLSLLGLHNPEVSDKILAVLSGIAIIFMGGVFALATAGFRKIAAA